MNKTDTKDKRCCAQVWDSHDWHNCENKAKVEHEGKWYCGIHDPIKIAAKEAARSKRWADEAKVSAEQRRRRAAESHFCRNITTKYLESN